MLKGASELHQKVTEVLENKSSLSSLEAMLKKLPRSIVNLGCTWDDKWAGTTTVLVRYVIDSIYIVFSR